jgi:hypothetical protein
LYFNKNKNFKLNLSYLVTLKTYVSMLKKTNLIYRVLVLALDVSNRL